MNISKYSRRTLSDWLQIAVQANTAGYDIPPELIKLVQTTHDRVVKKERVPKAKTRKRKRLPRPAPPCDGCTDAIWVTFSCGKTGWSCEGSGKAKYARDGKTPVGVCTAR